MEVKAKDDIVRHVWGRGSKHRFREWHTWQTQFGMKNIARVHKLGVIKFYLEIKLRS